MEWAAAELDGVPMFQREHGVARFRGHEPNRCSHVEEPLGAQRCLRAIADDETASPSEEDTDGEHGAHAGECRAAMPNCQGKSYPFTHPGTDRARSAVPAALQPRCVAAELWCSRTLHMLRSGARCALRASRLAPGAFWGRERIREVFDG